MVSGTYSFFMTMDELTVWLDETRHKRGLHVVVEYFFPARLGVIAPNGPLDLATSPNCVYFCATAPQAEDLQLTTLGEIGYRGDWVALTMERNTEEVLYLLRLSYNSAHEEGGKLFRSLRSSLKRMLTSGVVALGPNGEPGIRHNTLHYSAGAAALLATGVVWKQYGVSRGSFRPAQEPGDRERAKRVR